MADTSSATKRFTLMWGRDGVYETPIAHADTLYGIERAAYDLIGSPNIEIDNLMVLDHTSGRFVSFETQPPTANNTIYEDPHSPMARGE